MVAMRDASRSDDGGAIVLDSRQYQKDGWKTNLLTTSEDNSK